MDAAGFAVLAAMIAIAPHMDESQAKRAGVIYAVLATVAIVATYAKKLF